MSSIQWILKCPDSRSYRRDTFFKINTLDRPIKNNLNGMGNRRFYLRSNRRRFDNMWVGNNPICSKCHNANDKKERKKNAGKKKKFGFLSSLKRFCFPNETKITNGKKRKENEKENCRPVRWDKGTS